MIALTDKIPHPDKPSAEFIRLSAVFECYKEDALFWRQDEDKAFICMLDGNMTVYNRNANTEELKEFIGIMNPSSIFTDEKTLKAIVEENITSSYVFAKKSVITGDVSSDEINSRRVYDLFSRSGLTVGDYGYFAVDFCRRINRGYADCFFKTDKCAAFSVHSGDYALVQGIASVQKGMGTVALNAIMQKNSGRTVIACCEEKICGFYEKNGFRELYKAAFWVK